ncbi:hypothetical protein JCM19992_17220 [Thermostilla marina]
MVAAYGDRPANVRITVRSGTLRGRLLPGDIVVCFAGEPLFVAASCDGEDGEAGRQVEPGELAVILAGREQDSPHILRFFDAAETDNLETEAASRWWEKRLHTSSRTGYRHVGRYWLLPGPAAMLRIPTKILVDDDEPAARAVWEARLRERIERANDVLRKAVGTELEVVAVSEWRSDDKVQSFSDTFREFVSNVSPEPGELAIGFTSQWPADARENRLGGARGLLGTHVLLRTAGAKVTEAERLQMLLHELGHYLGAVHIRDADSLMQPVLEERRARAKEFHLGFDPLNTLLVNLLVDEIVQQHGRSERLPASTSEKVYAVLDVIDRVGPKDGSSARLREVIALLADPPAPLGTPGVEPVPPQPASANDSDSHDEPRREEITTRQGRDVDNDTPEEKPSVPRENPSPSESIATGKSREIDERPAEHPELTTPIGTSKEQVVPSDEGIAASAGAIVRAVVEQARQTRQGSEETGGRLEGDGWTEYLVRETASAACRLPADRQSEAPKAFLLALGVLFDDSDMMRRQPIVGRVWREIETEDQRAWRIRSLGRITIQDRHDWAQHFAVSAALTAVVGPGMAETAGRMKEWRDSDGGSGWSFADLGADLVGVEFAQRILTSRLSLQAVSQNFRLDDFFPPLHGMEEGLSRDDVLRRYGGMATARMNQAVETLRRTILERPGYSASP